MGHHSLMATCVLVALALPRFVHGRPAIDNSGSLSSMLESHVPKPEVWDEQRAISSFIRGSLSIPTKIRQKRISDQRLAELETRVTLSKITEKRSLEMQGNIVDLKKIGRRKRFAMDQIPAESVPIRHDDNSSRYNGDLKYFPTSCINR